MIILKQCERISLVVSESSLMADRIQDIKILFLKRTYETEVKGFKCKSHPEERPLYPNLRQEYTDNLEDAKKEFARMKMFFTTITPAQAPLQTPAPTPDPTPAPAPAPASGLGDQLQDIMLKVLAEQSVDKVLDVAKPMLEKHIRETFGMLPIVHEVKTPKATYKITGALHEKFDTVLSLVNMDIPVFLSGQAGTGKNVICKQIAEATGLEFYFTNAVTQEYQLKGFIDANGTFHETQFYKAFTQGGLFFLDEMDASIPETLIILNSAIANRYFDFPIGKVDAHENLRIISAGNTVGTGADIEYTGRFQLDASSLDRFALIQIGYSENIENAVTNANDELCMFARQFRTITEKASIRCLFTYRSMERISKMEDMFPLHDVLRMSLTKGLRVDDLKIISRKFDEMGISNKYVQALKKLAR